MLYNDFPPSSDMFNQLPDVHDQPEVSDNDLLKLGAVFQKHNVTDKYMLGLLHRHYPLGKGEMAVTSDIAKNVSVTRATKITSAADRSLRGQLYYLNVAAEEWQAYEFEDGPAVKFDPAFLTDLAAEVVQLGLVNMISLGSSKNSLGTREMQIGEKATVSIAQDSQGLQWNLDTDVKVKVVGWGFVEENSTIMIATYVGHATSDVSGNHMVLYTANNCSYTSGFLPESDLYPSKIVELLIAQGWLKAD